MNLLARLLHTLGNIADTQDCDRPSEALTVLMSQAEHYNDDELHQLRQELDTMKAVIGSLSLEVEELQNKKDDVSETHTVVKMMPYAKKN